MKEIYLLIFFAYGTIFGSFFNLIANRLPDKRSIVSPPSHCDNCLHKLKWYELIPILSYIFQLGRCNYCKSKIPFENVLIELITGILFAVAYNSFGFSDKLVISLIFISTLITVIVSDIERMIILDEVLLVGSILILLYMMFFIGWKEACMALLFGILSFFSMYLLKIIGDFAFKRESLGGGDIKLMFIFGIVLGYEMSIISIFLATFLAFPVALFVLFKHENNIIPFGPFLSIAALMILVSKINLHTIIDFLIN